MDNGAFIMHRCHGISSEVNLACTRAVTKMKATITQRFVLDGSEVDVEGDCRFLFFWHKLEDLEAGTLEWRAKFVRHWYEKDKMIPVDPHYIPDLEQALLQHFPSGYRYLAYCQQVTMGITVAPDLPGHNRERRPEGGSMQSAAKHDVLYWQAKAWLEGETVDF
jgi:hypothetical protein